MFKGLDSPGLTTPLFVSSLLYGTQKAERFPQKGESGFIKVQPSGHPGTLVKKSWGLTVTACPSCASRQGCITSLILNKAFNPGNLVRWVHYATPLYRQGNQGTRKWSGCRPRSSLHSYRCIQAAGFQIPLLTLCYSPVSRENHNCWAWTE